MFVKMKVRDIRDVELFSIFFHKKEIVFPQIIG